MGIPRILNKHKSVYDDIAPATELDSFIREMFCRLVERDRSITIDLIPEREPGSIKWSKGATPAGAEQITFWFEPTK